MPRQNTYKVPFEEFVSYLRERDFQIGVDTYLKVKHLVNSLHGDFDPSRLKFLLCPIIANSQEEQDLFYLLFDEYFRQSNVKDSKDEKKETISSEISGPKRQRIHWLVYVAILVIPTLVILGWKVAVCDCFDGSYESMKYCLSNSCDEIFDANCETNPDIDCPSPVPPPSPASCDTCDLTLPQLKFYKESVIPEEINDLKRTTYETNRWTRPLLGGIASAFVLYVLLGRLIRKKRRRYLLEEDHNKKPPFNYQLEVALDDFQLFRDLGLLDAAKSLKNRLSSDFYTLDIDKTIDATIKHAGFPTFVHSRSTRQPEYLILVEQKSSRDFLWKYYHQLIHELQSQEVIIEDYYFKEDLQCVFDAETDRSFTLEELEVKFHHRRLIIISDGDFMIDGVTGLPTSIMETITIWKERALLSTRLPADWGYNEVVLDEYFHFLPATIQGFSTLIDQFETDIKQNIGEWIRTSGGNHNINFEAEKVSSQLRGYLGEASFQLLCALSLYPELHWDLMISFAHKFYHRSEVLSQDNLLRLCALPWLRQGEMPKNVRKELMGLLKNPDEHREYLFELLYDNEPAEGTFAHDQYEARLLIQKINTTPSSKDRIRISKRLEQLHGTGELKDASFVKYAEDRNKRRFFGSILKHGLEKDPYYAPQKNMRKARNILVSLGLVLLYFLLPFLENKFHILGKEKVDFKPESQSEWVRYHNKKGLDHLHEEDYEKALNEFINAVDLDDAYVPALVNEVFTLEYQGKYEEAETAAKDVLENYFKNDEIRTLFNERYATSSTEFDFRKSHMAMARAIEAYEAYDYQQSLAWIAEAEKARGDQFLSPDPSQEFFKAVVVLSEFVELSRGADESAQQIAVYEAVNILVDLYKTHDYLFREKGKISSLLRKVRLYHEEERSRQAIDELLQQIGGPEGIDINKYIVKIYFQDNGPGAEESEQLISRFRAWIRDNNSYVRLSVHKLYEEGMEASTRTYVVRYPSKMHVEHAKTLVHLIETIGYDKRVVFESDESLLNSTFVIDLREEIKEIELGPNELEVGMSGEFMGDWYGREYNWKYRISGKEIRDVNRDQYYDIQKVIFNERSRAYTILVKREEMYTSFYLRKRNEKLDLARGQNMYQSDVEAFANHPDRATEILSLALVKTRRIGRLGYDKGPTIPQLLRGSWYNDSGVWMWGIEPTSIRINNKYYALEAVYEATTSRTDITKMYRITTSHEGQYYSYTYAITPKGTLLAGWGDGPFETEEEARYYTYTGNLIEYTRR